MKTAIIKGLTRPLGREGSRRRLSDVADELLCILSVSQGLKAPRRFIGVLQACPARDQFLAEVPDIREGRLSQPTFHVTRSIRYSAVSGVGVCFNLVGPHAIEEI